MSESAVFEKFVTNAACNGAAIKTFVSRTILTRRDQTHPDLWEVFLLETPCALGGCEIVEQKDSPSALSR